MLVRFINYLCSIDSVRNLIKNFLIWFVAFVIPIQGFASVSMMNCEQTTNHHSQEISDTYYQVQHSMHGMANEHGHHEVDASEQSLQGEDKSKHSCAHCAECTTCFSGFTFQPPPSNSLQQLNASEARFSSNTPLLTGFIPSGLERPPRFTLI